MSSEKEFKETLEGGVADIKESMGPAEEFLLKMQSALKEAEKMSNNEEFDEEQIIWMQELMRVKQ